jgi:hypothetical protein
MGFCKDLVALLLLAGVSGGCGGSHGEPASDFAALAPLNQESHEISVEGPVTKYAFCGAMVGKGRTEADLIYLVYGEHDAPLVYFGDDPNLIPEVFDIRRGDTLEVGSDGYIAKVKRIPRSGGVVESF